MNAMSVWRRFVLPLAVAGGLVAGLGARGLFAGDVLLKSEPDGKPFVVGAAVADITPEIGPGKRTVFLGGSGVNRPARRVLDPITARALVVEHGGVKIALAAVDLVGFMNNEVAAVRESLPAAWGINYLMVCATHVHSAPDSIGIWALPLGADRAWLAKVRERIKEAVGRANEARRPARLTHFLTHTGVKGFIRDSRPPEVIDDTLTAMKFDDAETGATIATVVGWGNHPETIPLDGNDLSSDFPHFLREGVASGVGAGDKRVLGVGGTVIFWNACVGGLMTPLGVPVKRFDTGEVVAGESYKKAQALGDNLAAITLKTIAAGGTSDDQPRLYAHARRVRIPVSNPRFRLAALTGLIQRDNANGTLESEVGVVEIGLMQAILAPGEVYPELVVGGVEMPEGHDRGDRVLEKVPLKKAMENYTKFPWVIGLANDELGYLLPYTQWDEQKPFTYQLRSAPYGEENSPGPEGGPRVYGEIYHLLKERAGG
ncbi:MAG: hypothetical protein HY719_17040 [Planctomycetes bacterium]|nr:hypothetical protein [Planctomycetota bacterium]